jgi:hypothetical protein
MDGPWASNVKASPDNSTSGKDYLPSRSSTVASSDVPFLPTLAVTSPDNYGGLDPENEANLDIIEGVSGETFRRSDRQAPDSFCSEASHQAHLKTGTMQGMTYPASSDRA